MDKPTCKVDWCTRQARSLGYCLAHYKRHRKGSDMDAPLKGVPKKCRVPECHNEALSKGLCNAHYLRARSGGDMSVPVRKVIRTGRTCSVPGCGKKHMGKGYCSNHYGRYRRRKFWRHILQERGYRCAKCGRKYHPAVFDLHHRDPKQKKLALGQAAQDTAWDVLIDEAAKCDLLCANCHRIVHFDGHDQDLFPL